MANYSTLGHNLKRGIFQFCGKLSAEFHKPVKKFICDMIFGLIAAKSCFLTDISRHLHEDIALDKTVERLSRNLKSFADKEKLMEAYFTIIRREFDDDTILIIDDSDIAKPFSKKLEAVCEVRDGSTGEITTGYWVAGASALTAKHKQPIPVYSRIYSSLEENHISKNDETIKSLESLSKNFKRTNIRALDRGYDAGCVLDYFLSNKEDFVIRMRGDRHCIYNEEKLAMRDVAKQFKGKFVLHFKRKSGEQAKCKVSIATISLPNYPEQTFSLVICKGLGKEPMMLLTNLQSDDKRLCVVITKVYLMRWRIEEYYKFKKQGYAYEKFLVRSLDSIRNLDMLLSMAIGYIGILSEKIDEKIEVIEIVVASKRLYGLAKFTFYAIAYGLAMIFSKAYVGISGFFLKPPISNQLVFAGCF